MFVALRVVSLILLCIALMLLGADLVTTLERSGEFTLRSLYDDWALFSKDSAEGFRSWLEHTLPMPVSSWIAAVLQVWGWLFFGVLGMILAFLFGRRQGEAE